jgi:hypothetical protein
LPNLISYQGPSSFIPFSNLDSGTLIWMSLQWCPDDLDVDTPLLHLGRMSSPTEILGLSSYDDLKDSTILGGVARHLPHIHSLQLENTGVFKVCWWSSFGWISLTFSCRRPHRKSRLISKNSPPCPFWNLEPSMIAPPTSLITTAHRSCCTVRHARA